MSACEVCGRGPAPEEGGVAVYRQNEPGQMPAVWRCVEHPNAPIEPEVQELMDAICGRVR